MTIDEMHEAARAFVLAVSQFRREHPDEVSSIITVGVQHGAHQDDRGWWLLACNKASAVPFKPGSKEWYDAYPSNKDS